MNIKMNISFWIRVFIFSVYIPRSEVLDNVVTILILFGISVTFSMGFSGGASGKEPACQCRRHKRCRFNPCVGKIPWRKAWQPTPVFLPGESHWRGAWWATVPRATKRTQLTMHTCILFSIVFVPNCIPTNSVRVFPFFFTLSPAFTVCRLFSAGHFDWCEMITHCSFDLPFSDN